MANNPYIRVTRNGKVVYLHRWEWEQVFGPIPKGWEIDHINGIKTDNHLDNLRCVPQAAQRRNAAKRIDNQSGIQGVSRWETIRRGNQKISMWRAVAHNQSGKQIIKAFSISKYGEEKAFELACMARKQMEKDFGYHPNHGR